MTASAQLKLAVGGGRAGASPGSDLSDGFLGPNDQTPRLLPPEPPGILALIDLNLNRGF